jgi:signal transduction histidine kinase
VDLNEVVVRSVDAMREVASRRDITLTLAKGVIPLVHADLSLLQQALLNLLANAFDAVDESGRSYKAVEVFTCSSAACVQICVMDSGCGIPEPDLQRIFESFRTGKPMGLGLGLSIARAIATAHGGRVFAENNLCGPGAIVRIELPVAVSRKADVVLI